MAIKPKISRYTVKQNSAIHVYCRQVAEALNDGGFDMQKVLACKPMSIPWTKISVKEFLWKEVLKAISLKQSTTEMITTEPNEVYDILNRFLGENFSIHVPFPKNEDK